MFIINNRIMTQNLKDAYILLTSVSITIEWNQHLFHVIPTIHQCSTYLLCSYLVFSNNYASCSHKHINYNTYKRITVTSFKTNLYLHTHLLCFLKPLLQGGTIQCSVRHTVSSHDFFLLRWSVIAQLLSFHHKRFVLDWSFLALVSLAK